MVGNISAGRQCWLCTSGWRCRRSRGRVSVRQSRRSRCSNSGRWCESGWRIVNTSNGTEASRPLRVYKTNLCRHSQDWLVRSVPRACKVVRSQEEHGASASWLGVVYAVRDRCRVQIGHVECCGVPASILPVVAVQAGQVFSGCNRNDGVRIRAADRSA